MKKIKLVVLLGNPGKIYIDNRHNAGRLLVHFLRFDLRWQAKFKGLYSTASVPSNAGHVISKVPSLYVMDAPVNYGDDVDAALLDGIKVDGIKAHFLMPETFMNLSGESVIAAAGFYKIRCEEVLVVHDELDLPLGHAAFKKGGGLGGHNGLRSIKSVFDSADFWRLRIGIGRPGGKKDPSADISAWVLSNFTEDEAVILRQVHEACAAALLKALVNGPDSLLPEWNKMRLYPAGGS
ncbi:MAG: aminoacyl-tRNA hydrolase [Spirochaetaceae bacterium]|jgi:PTH1 family peptidyl-tRNA hydrolase|nr:aminoacyl-tRNA hydrolase [Spirochaetaceae bacterium]